MYRKNVLPKPYRLAKGDIKNALQNGSFLRGRLVSLKVLKSGLGKVRVGFLLRKKGLAQAVLRNKAKRRLRAAVSRYKGDLKTGLDILVIADHQILKQRFEELCAELRKLFKRSRFIQP